MVGKVFKIICFGWAGILAVGFVFTILMPYVFSVFADEKLHVSIANRSGREISALVEITDLDSNRSELKTITNFQAILPGKTAVTELWLDGWAPETCSKIVIRSQAQEKSYDCGPREKLSGRYHTKADIVFSD